MTDQTAATECAFADEGCTCGRPRLTLTEAQARMAATPKPGPTFATYLDRHDRDQLDARAACAEQERDEALDDRNALRQQLDIARAELGAAQELLAVVDDLAEQLDRARARYATRPEVTPVEPEHAHTLGTACPANGCRWPLPNAGLGSATPRAQDVLAEVATERERQDAKWGEQNHGDADSVILNRLDAGGKYGTPEAVARRLAEFYEIPTAGRAKFLCEKEEPPTWAGIAVEELAEVLEATTGDPAKLRAEWIQLAAVAVAAVEAMDRR